MFKMAKYYVLVNLYRNARKNIMFIVLSLMLMTILSYFFADLASMKEERAYVLAVKWIVYLVLLSIVVWNMYKMKSVAFLPFSQKFKENKIDIKKEKILKKEQLLGRSERILNKYRKAG